MDSTSNEERRRNRARAAGKEVSLITHAAWLRRSTGGKLFPVTLAISYLGLNGQRRSFAIFASSSVHFV
jgi:hypothetical protein